MVCLGIVNVLYYISYTTWWFTIFKGYMSFIVTINFGYNPCVVYHCSLLILYLSLYLLILYLCPAPPPLHYPLITTSFFSVSMNLILFCYIY